MFKKKKVEHEIFKEPESELVEHDAASVPAPVSGGKTCPCCGSVGEPGSICPVDGNMVAS